MRKRRVDSPIVSCVCVVLFVVAVITSLLIGSGFLPTGAAAWLGVVTVAFTLFLMSD